MGPIAESIEKLYIHSMSDSIGICMLVGITGRPTSNYAISVADMIRKHNIKPALCWKTTHRVGN